MKKTKGASEKAQNENIAAASSEKRKKLVYVLAKDGTPLMPCEPVIARLLLKQKKAKVKRREPFTIKLLYESTKFTQPLTLGIDTGSGALGAAVVNEKAEIVYASEVEVRNDIKDRMDRRRAYHRSRRSRKTRHRKARFKYRKNSIRKDRLNPTMVSKLHSHEKEIAFVKSILPITGLVIEGSQFDPHLMKNPALSSPKVRPWGYQKGECYGFDNVKAMVRARDGEICPICQKKMTLRHVHHILFRENGGSDVPSNLVTICPDCHKKLHAGELRGEKKKRTEALKGTTKGTLAYATQMNVIRSQILKNHPEAVETFGYVTSHNRLAYGLKKEHWLDVALIASGGKEPVLRTNVCLRKVSIPEGDMQQTQGKGSEQRLTTCKIDGFRKFDKVEYQGTVGFIKGRMQGSLRKDGTRASGYAILIDIDGNEISFAHLPKGWKTPKLANMKRISARKSQMVQEKTVSL